MFITTARMVRGALGVTLLALAGGPPVCGAQTAGAEPNGVAAPVKWTAQQDHQNMMEQLGIKTLRRGADGMSRQSPYYQNTDESKANPWPNLPDPLVLKNGQSGRVCCAHHLSVTPAKDCLPRDARLALNRRQEFGFV